MEGIPNEKHRTTAAVLGPTPGSSRSQLLASAKGISARKFKSSKSYELANFTTSSLFKPHVTTIGLYDDNNELLVVGKLSQPIKSSDETDTTFVVRWDT